MKKLTAQVREPPKLLATLEPSKLISVTLRAVERLAPTEADETDLPDFVAHWLSAGD